MGWKGVGVGVLCHTRWPALFALLKQTPLAKYLPLPSSMKRKCIKQVEARTKEEGGKEKKRERKEEENNLWLGLRLHVHMKA